jgi:SAM-dependent methyltransferase
VWLPAFDGAYVERDGIWRCLADARLAALEPFLRHYRAVREHEGRRKIEADYYRALPVVGPNDPHAAEWQIRRESYGHLLRHCFASAPHALRVLDLGAGCGWLSHRLAQLGHRVVSVDLLDDEADGLGAVRHYMVRFAAVQADFDRLPFGPAQFDVVIFNGSLHYAADLATTLWSAHRMLAAGGSLVVMDSPMFRDARHGAAMMAARRDAVHGAGYVTYAQLDAVAIAAAMTATFVASRGPIGWRLRRAIARWRLGRAPAAFGVWIAR